jgi:pyruvate dehydrogenase E2 component (dihydrolipoamide acetyltransferase)
MAIDITIPRLGWNMDEGIFVAWLKNEGDFVKAGETLFTLETDKAVQEVESLDSGTLRILASGPNPGDTVAVGTVIGRLRQHDESDVDNDEVSQVAIPSERSNNEPRQHGELNSRSETIAHPKPIVKAPRSSPRARRKARELGIDWTTLKGSGRSGRVRERDVLAVAASYASGSPGTFAEGDFQATPIAPTRRLIADRMMNSAHGTAAVTLMSTIDATNLVNLRQQFKTVAREQKDQTGTTSVSYSDIVIKLAAIALERHPRLNSRWDGHRIVQFNSIHIGLAVDTEAGLLVPVIRDVPGLSIRQVAARSHDLIERARGRELKSDELQGGTFSITNLGSFGIDAFTPIINAPQCAVLGMGRIVKQPAELDQQLALRHRMTLCLTFDHRIVDGAPAARFLQNLGSLLENPSPWLLP